MGAKKNVPDIPLSHRLHPQPAETHTWYACGSGGFRASQVDMVFLCPRGVRKGGFHVAGGKIIYDGAPAFSPGQHGSKPVIFRIFHDVMAADCSVCRSLG